MTVIGVVGLLAVQGNKKAEAAKAAQGGEGEEEEVRERASRVDDVVIRGPAAAGGKHIPHCTRTRLPNKICSSVS